MRMLSTKDMMRKILAALLCLISLSAAACLDASLSGDDKKNAAPVADAGMDTIARPGAMVFLDGSTSFDNDGKIVLYHWQITGCSWSPPTLSNAEVATPVFRVPESAASGQYVTLRLTVTDDDGKTSSDDITITVKELSPVGDLEDYKDILYCAYAGIGYGNPGIQDDDAFLYDVMMEDLNTIGVYFAQELIQALMDDETELYYLSLGYNSNVTKTLPGNYTAKLFLNPEILGSGQYSFAGNIQVVFDEFIFDERVAYSGGGTCDFRIDFEGSCGIEYLELTSFIVDTVVIRANSTMSADYTDAGHSVQYDGWKISYNVNDTVNRLLLANALYFDSDNPGLNNPGDTRDYSLEGQFSVDSIAHRYYTGFRCRQSAAAEYAGLSGNWNVMSVQGMLNIPGTDEVVSVDSVYDPVDPAVSDSILKDEDDGLWKSGSLTINGVDMTVDFLMDGDDESAVFNGSTAVPRWQTELELYN